MRQRAARGRVPDGEIVCTFMVQQALGINDFQPMIARSRDGGRTWGSERFIFPDLANRFSLFGSVSQDPRDGSLIFYASRYRIDKPGEPNWSDATKGLKENELIWSRSTDRGQTWSEPRVIPMQIAGSAEAPGPICAMRSGRWACCYAPYNTFDPNLKVDRNQLAGMFSDDQGKTWKYQPIMRFPLVDRGAAEAWVIQLADGKLLATSWVYDYADASDLPNQYALSSDDGRTWQGPFSTGIRGQSTGLLALPDGRAVMTYNQRKPSRSACTSRSRVRRRKDLTPSSTSPSGVPPSRRRRQGASVDHTNWQAYAFGEPSAVRLPDGDLLCSCGAISPIFPASAASAPA
jgi:hypothetical protein